jgi:hypothetical protein
VSYCSRAGLVINTYLHGVLDLDTIELSHVGSGDMEICNFTREGKNIACKAEMA